MKYFNDPENEYKNYKTSKIVFLPVPYDRTASYKKGARLGPDAIIDASYYMEDYDDELGKQTYKMGMTTLKPLGSNRMRPQGLIDAVEKKTRRILEDRKFPVILGGEHTVTVGAVRACAAKFKNLSVLHLDAHCDLREHYEGTRFSHACVAKRNLEACDVIEAGIRSISVEEAAIIKKFKKNKRRLKIFSAYDMLKMSGSEKKILSALSKNVYVTIDMDVFDPSVIPSVGTPEPGGLNWYEVIRLLRKVADKKSVCGFDIVELKPVEENIAPDFLAAKLAYRFLGYIFK